MSTQATAAPDPAPLHLAREGAVLIVTIANPPVNALGVAVRRGLLAAIEEGEADADVAAILLTGAGRNFIGGADIREFGKPPQAPLLTELCNRIEACSKPVLAAIHGAALGGGLEVALAAHYRLVLSNARLGLPEVQLGLLPGAGGTQRTPRLIGAQAALDMMLTGRHLSATEALAMGLVDQLAEGDSAEQVRAAGLREVRALLDAGAPVRRSRDALALADTAATQAAIAAARTEASQTSRGLFSPYKIIDAVEAATTLPFEEGLALERKFFLQCLESPQRAGLIHAFFAEREVLKIPETRNALPRHIERIGIVGGGTMAACIAVAVLDAGLPATMIERDDAALADAREQVEKIYAAQLAARRLTPEARSAVLARLQGSTRPDDLAGADVVIEAVSDDLAVKQALLAELDRVCKPGAVLATTTASLDIDALAASISRPAEVIGLHFFAPANGVKLLEIVVPRQAGDDVVATAFELAKRLRKVPVRAGAGDGFIADRILAVYRQAAAHLLEDGASPAEIDTALCDFGFATGPFQGVDLAGGDLGQATRQHRAGRTPRSFSQDEIRRRCLAALINEGANVVHQGIALRPLDVDVSLLYGYGFPRHRGGPMKYADMIGLSTVLADIRAFAADDPLFWTPSPLLVDLVERGASFDSLNQAC